MFPDDKVDIPFCERIFCNRTLNMKSIKAVGFDMDYTLALYKPETFEKLAYEETLKKLVDIGYSKEILNWEFDHKYMIRGLVIDKIRGNVLKMDRHRYVKVAFHGFKELNREERRKLYDVENVIIYEEPNFALIDTLFSLAEAFLFIQLVDYKDKTEKLLNKTYLEIYNDVRKCIDLCHRDGSIKYKVSENPGKYITKDKNLVSILKDLKASGRKIFIVTNSLWDYTNVVMNYICGNSKKELNFEWISYFDLVITGSQKPSFFNSKNQIYSVDLKTCYLKNIDLINLSKNENNEPKVFQGGHFKLLYDILGIKVGSEILYIGDHIYGDILRSKKEIGWRTMLVIEELEKEISAIQNSKDQYTLCDSLNKKRVHLENEFERLQIAEHENKIKKGIDKDETLDKKIKKVGYDLLKIKELEKKEIRTYHLGLHPIWGELMKTGRQNSRFAAQVETYACLYTSKLTNLIHYGPHKNFRAVRDFMPHDLDD
ncbi:HAD-IG family 5'-nucleotidase [Silvanigrella paludirubra]|uniref:HAD-IG family 5'-nucleotidase n=1 Tax=Silvanigrella paludirubra TaxID=2499159 RepID=A0A6N6VU33_9BACT|nr:HAD-IG family 5'-nucleotidase [Silvanigrella paludirubra]KAB8039840.1 HAD-IG family 5'-nucleotidase [Silvanigrella paludirubra]